MDIRENWVAKKWWNGNKTIAEYEVGKTAEYIKSSVNTTQTFAAGGYLRIEATLYATDYSTLKYHHDWNSMIDVLKKLTPELEKWKDKIGDHEKKEEVGLLLCSIEVQYVMYDIEKLWERVVEAINFLNDNNYSITKRI